MSLTESLFREYIQKHGRFAAAALLGEFGARNLSGVPADKVEAFTDKLIKAGMVAPPVALDHNQWLGG